MRRGAERSRARLSTLDATVEKPRSGSLSRGALVETAHDRRQTPPRDTNDPGLSVQQIEQGGSGLPDPRRFLGCTRAAARGKAEPISHDLTGDEPVSSRATRSYHSEGSALSGSHRGGRCSGSPPPPAELCGGDWSDDDVEPPKFLVASPSNGGFFADDGAEPPPAGGQRRENKLGVTLSRPG